MAKKKIRPPKLPKLLDTKIYKTGQTRGADDDVIYQNRVSRSSTVLIPYTLFDEIGTSPSSDDSFTNEFIVLITPKEYFDNPNIVNDLESKNLVLGQNALIFYQMRSDWDANNPESLGWSPASNRKAPLNGKYVARIAATTSIENSEKISRGFNTKGMKGAGIRLFEYASKNNVDDCRIQLEAIFWLCFDSVDVVIEFGMAEDEAVKRRDYCLSLAKEKELLEHERLIDARMINNEHKAICPLCLEPLTAYGFFNRLVQATGREVHDLTVTEINLFHIQELRYGQYNHRPYNLGWGHHHCNVVVKDAGIEETIVWMNNVLQKNIEQGYFQN